ncbi:MAG: hypothetical protein RLZZ206_753 [Cyanobacteriota bacterium]|jgi:hypothetical protein
MSTTTTAEARPLITWQPGWRELDLIFGLAFDATAAPTRLDPAAYASVPRDGVQLADVRLQGSPEADRVVVGTGAMVEAGAGSDELDNTDSRGGNLLAGGMGTDRFLLRAAGDMVIGGDLLANASGLGLPAVVGQVDGERDVFLIDSSNPSPEGTLGILDFELGRDELLLDGLAPTGSWSTVRQLLQGLGIAVNAAPQLGSPLITLSLQPGVEESHDLGSLASDSDGNLLQLVKLEGPAWITTSGTTVTATAPIGSSEEQLAALSLRLAFSDGQAAVPLAVRLTLNKAPSALTLANTVSSLAENSSTASRIKVADIVITDDASGSNTISLSGADAASFEVSGNALFLKAGTALNFEAKASYAFTVSVSDSTLPGSTPVSTAFALAVTDVNEPPTAITLSSNTIAENTVTPVKIGNLSVTDPDASGNNNVLSLEGSDAASFYILNSNELFFIGASPNFEAHNPYAITVKATDGSHSYSQPLTVNVSDVNEAPTAIALSLNPILEIIFNGTSIKVGSLPENTSTTNRINVADILISDDALGSNVIELSGADASSFEVIGTGLFLKAGTTLDFEAKSAFNVTVSARDPALTGTLGLITAFQLVVRDVNEAPSALTLANAVSSLAENSSTASRIKVADIVIADDASGSNTISLSGADAASFEVSGNALFLKAGTALNFEAKASYAVTVSASDPSLSGSSPVSAAFNLSISDVNEVPGTTVETVVVAIELPTGESRQIPVTIGGASLSSGSEFKIVPVSGINQEGLDKLIQSGVKLNSTAIDFVVDVAQGQKFVALAASSELVAADLLPQLGNGSGRLSSRKLLFYAQNPDTGTISPLTFDPITGAGARFFDTNNDGAPDFFSLSLIDGGYGDEDGLRNGKIDDRSFAGFADLNNISFSSQASGMLTVAQLGNSAPVAVSLRANLGGRSSSSNEIGYVVLAPDELPGSANLLNDFAWLRGRAKTLLSSLESTDVTLPANTRFERDILLINGQSLRFFEVQDASLNQLTSLSDSRFRYLNTADIGNNQASFSSGSGVRFSLDILPGDLGLNALIAQAQVQAPVLDLSALTAAQSLQGTVALGREAEFDSVVGFYRALDAQGTIVAADGVTRLRPGDLGYGEVALRTGNLVNQLGNLSVADDKSTSLNFADVTGGSFLAPYTLVNGNTFFAYSAASSDGISHFRSLGNNLFGLEDVFGGGDLDYDDMVIGFNFTTII